MTQPRTSLDVGFPDGILPEDYSGFRGKTFRSIGAAEAFPFEDAQFEVVLVHAHRQGLGNRLEVWIQVAEGELRTQTLRVFGTGQPIPAEWRPLGSCVAGPFVWHLCGGE